MALRPKHVKALAWAISEAKAWRGSLTGHPDPQVLEAFDKMVADAKEGLREVKDLLPEPRHRPS